MRANHRQATLYCARKGMRLPTYEEYIAARDNSGLATQFPDLQHRYLWSSSEVSLGRNHGVAFIYIGSARKVARAYRAYDSSKHDVSARCVRVASLK